MPLNAPVTEISSVLAELHELHEACLAMEQEFAGSIAEACPQSRPSLQNLLHYLALRQHDLRNLQARLSALGLSSLGRNESNSLAGLESVIAILESLSCSQDSARSRRAPCVDFSTGSALLAEQAERLLGPVPKDRSVRVMVTMPSEAAHSYELVKGLVEAGMDVMRVNCAHDTEREWESIIAHMHRANQETGNHCRVLMDLAGPKVRTGPVGRGDRVVRWKVSRNARGAVIAPARVALLGRHAGAEFKSSDYALLPVPETLLHAARAGDTLRIRDSRKKKRLLTVTHKSEHACLCTCDQGAYVLSRAEWALLGDDKTISTGHLGELPFVEEPIRLRPRDLLILTKEGQNKEDGKPQTRHGDIPHISCTLPEAFSTVRPDQPIFFDDGKIEGRIREVQPDSMCVEIVHTASGGGKLGSAKGINFPETDLGVNAMTEKDRHDLDFVAAHADIVGLSFVRRPEDVQELLQELAARGKSDLGIILKIESKMGFDQLPLTMMAALRHHPVGIMVARGDLAVEVGFERLAEVQEEILWLSEAAHMPVIWATQVLETLAKTGMPSRAEVTDAAMGVGAECVMLNKGEYIADAVRFLDHVLQRMQAHHLKKRSMLRRLAVAQVSRAASPGSE